MFKTARFGFFISLITVLSVLCPSWAQQANPQPAPPVATQPTPTPTPEAAPPPPARKPRKRIRLGLEAGVYIPSASKTRDRFGGTRFGISPAIGELRQVTKYGRFYYDLRLYYQQRGDNYAGWAPIGIEYRKALTTGQSFRPYVGGSLDLVPNLIRSDPDGVHSRIRAGYGGSLFVGALLNRRRYIEARYTEISHVQGFDLSGLTLGAGIRF